MFRGEAVNNVNTARRPPCEKITSDLQQSAPCGERNLREPQIQDSARAPGFDLGTLSSPKQIQKTVYTLLIQYTCGELCR